MQNISTKRKKRRFALHMVGALSYILFLIAFSFAGYINYRQEKDNIIDSFRQSSIQIRDSIIDQIHYESFSSINGVEDMETELYKSLQEKLNSIRIATGVRYLYTAQALEDGTYIYVVDGLSPEEEDFAHPGMPIEEELFDYMKRGLQGETMMSEDFMDTGWGKICTAYFPIYDDPSQTYGILCMEFDMETAVSHMNEIARNFAIFSLLAGLILSILVTAVYKRLRDAREAVEKAYEDSNLRLETVLGGISGGFKISRNDEKFSYDYVSKAAAKIQGYTVEELMEASGGNAVDNVYPNDREEMLAAVKEQYKNGDTYSCRYRVIHKDGSLKWIFDSGKRIVNENGEVLHYSLYQDVSEFEEQNRELRNTMEMLDQERRQYRDALLNNCEFSYSFDVTEGLIYEKFVTKNGNDPIQSLGLSLPVQFDVLNQKWEELYQPVFRGTWMKDWLKHEEIVKQFEKGERAVEVEYYIPKMETYTRVTTLLFKNERTGHIQGFVIANDITRDRKEEEQKKRELLEAKLALEDAYERANRASAAKTDFLSNMSHDIRTPMNAIIGMTAIAGTHLDDRERVIDCLNKITVSSKHLLGLINEVLDMSKIESGKLDLNQEEFSLPDLISDLLTMSRTQAEEKGHELSVSIRGLVNENVIGDSQRLQQAFMNLLGNAIKYTPNGGKIQITISEKQTNKPKIGCYEFIFEDNGIGMTREYQEHLFEPFSRADDALVKKVQGTGLGMPITKNIVQMMNGNIQVESQPGKGTKFTVTIFLKLQNGENTVSYEAFQDLPVLVVDDEKTDCEVTCEMLNELGMNGEWVLSGEEAVERTLARHEAQNDYFALILDWKMPGMDGVSTAREIRRQVGEDVPIIILSAYDWSAIEAEAREAGVNAFISKPLFKSKMVHLFRELLGYENEKKQSFTLEDVSEEMYKGKRVLLVEDNELNAEIAGEIFGMLGIEVEFAGNGREAVDLMAKTEPGYYDGIFMDIQMPVMNGYEATRAIRKLPGEYVKKIPIIAMTANAFAEDVQNAKSAGMNEHITKPLELQQLMRALGKWL